MDSEHRFYLDNLWRRAAGLPEHDSPPSWEEIVETQWSPRFERLMRNRLLVGAYRYGLFGQIGKPKYDSVASMRKRLDRYEETGNLELLVDIANLCLVEFVEGRHPNAHWEAQDDGEHVAVKEGK